MEQAVVKLSLKVAYGKTPAERLQELEGGVRKPSRPMLVRMANTVVRWLPCMNWSTSSSATRESAPFGPTIPWSGSATTLPVRTCFPRKPWPPWSWA